MGRELAAYPKIERPAPVSRTEALAQLGADISEPAPLEVWQEVVARWPDMRFWVAQNKTVPIEILAVLATDDDANVRSMVAAKRSLPEDLQILLSRDQDESVRERLSRNARATRKVLEVLAADPSPEVRQLAAQRLAG